MKQVLPPRIELAAFRRTTLAREIEKKLRTVVRARTSTLAMNGAVGSSADTGRWLQKPKATEPSTNGIYRKMARAAKARGLTVAPSVWLWEVLKQQQFKEQIVGPERGAGGTKWRPNWRTETVATTPWEALLKTMLAAAVSRCGRKTMHKTSWRQVKQAGKKRVRGQGGVAIMQAALWALAMTEGLEVEGLGNDAEVSGMWEDREWWQEVKELAEVHSMSEEVEHLSGVVMGWAVQQDSSGSRKGRSQNAKGSGKGNGKVWIHYCAGDGRNIHGVAKRLGVTVVAVDNGPFPKAPGVIRVTMDLSKVSQRLWIREACRLARVSESRVEAILAGPPCRTYAHSDPSNKRHGMNYQYRDHSALDAEGLAYRPPMHPEGTKRGDLAREHDDISMKLALLCKETELMWYIENPEAYLKYRPHMRSLEGYLRKVHYCAYWTAAEARQWRPIQKPTNLWTNAWQWAPKGQTGTGLCGGRCRWRDKEGNHKKLEGTGTAWQRSRMPSKLVEEWALSWAR
jgi:hypothetical protein